MTSTSPGPGSANRPDAALLVASGWVGRRIRLRGVRPGDRRTLVRFDRDSAAGAHAQPEGYRHWAAHRANHPESGDDFQLAIETRRDGVLVGSMCTSQAEPGSGIFSYGIGIGPQHRRLGYADDAIITLLAYMFGLRRYGKCQVGIYGDNLASLRLHGKLGFREELQRREFRFTDAQQLIVMGLTAQEFTARYPMSQQPARSLH